MKLKVLNIVSTISYLLIYIGIFIIPRFLGCKGSTFLWVQTISYTVLGLLSIVVFWKYYKKSIELIKKNPIRMFIWIVAIFVGIIILDNILLLPLYYYNPDYESINANNIAGAVEYIPKLLIVIAFGILGPITEECIFRGILVLKLKGKIPAVLLIIVSSIVFMLLHMHSFSLEELLVNLPILGSGILLAVAIYKTDNISIVFIVHVLNNLLSIIMTLYFK